MERCYLIAYLDLQNMKVFNVVTGSEFPTEQIGGTGVRQLLIASTEGETYEQALQSMASLVKNEPYYAWAKRLTRVI